MWRTARRDVGCDERRSVVVGFHDEWDGGRQTFFARIRAQQRPRNHVERQISRVVLQSEVLLTVDWQTHNQRKRSRLVGKVHDVEGIAELRHVAVEQVYIEQAVELGHLVHSHRVSDFSGGGR